MEFKKKPKNETKSQRTKRLEHNKKYRVWKAQQDADALTGGNDDQNPKDQTTVANDQTDGIEDATIVDDNTASNDDSIQDIGYSPFNEPVTKRAYTIPKIDPSELSGELEEPIFKAPSLEDLETADTEAKTEEPTPKKSEPTQFNKQFSELPNKEKEMGAEMMADVVLDGYEKLGSGLGSLAKISEDKLEREYADETIDPNLQLPINEMGDTVTVREFVKEFNEETSSAFETTKEFKEKVRPPLIRVFKKRGVGMTDEQQLAYYFGTDLASKGFTAFQLKKASNGILEQLRQQTDIARGQMHTQPRPSTAQQSQNTSTHQHQPAQTEPVKTEHVEPEEMTTPIVMDKENNIVVGQSEGFAETKHAENMPTFGDKQLLEDMEKLAKREEAKRLANKSNKNKDQ